MVYLLRDDVTTLLMNVLVVPVFAEDLDDRGIFTRQELHITHQTEANANGTFFGLIEIGP